MGGIFWAASADIDIMKALLRARAQPQVPNKFGYTPFMRALHYGSLEGAQLLLEAQAELCAADKFRSTPMLIAATNGDLDAVKWLLSKDCGGQLHSTSDESGRLPLIQAAKGNFSEICLSLLDAKANADCFDADGRGPLLFALVQHNVDLTEQLLRRGADINMQDVCGCPLLHSLMRELLRLSKEKEDENAEAAILCGVATALEKKADPDGTD